ncbi:MAG: hypothetical protein Q7T33_03345 [Dehalococcoidia bacterium]|nr:hypothetical protein [Dehalococcoidia bacterium]
MDLNPDESQEHSRLLNDFVAAQERYKSLLPRVAVAAGREQPASAPGEQFLLLAQEADRDRLLAREALYRFRESHGIPQ